MISDKIFYHFASGLVELEINSSCFSPLLNNGGKLFSPSIGHDFFAFENEFFSSIEVNVLECYSKVAIGKFCARQIL